MMEIMATRGLEILGDACIFVIGCVVGYYSRRPTQLVVSMPTRDEHGRFLPWKPKETA